MLFFPYRAAIEQWRFPVVTLLICAVAMIMLAHQYNQKAQLRLLAVQTCFAQHDRELVTASKVLASKLGVAPEMLCTTLLTDAYVNDRPQALIRQWAFASADKLSPQEYQRREYINQVFQRVYQSFSIAAPVPLTELLWYDPAPEKVNALNMVTSIFAHNNVLHLVGNLFFFFAFAATIEMIIGSVSLLATIVLLSLLTNGFYTVISTLEGSYVPTIGLSGVVFGMMGMFACFLPHARVRCFTWLFVFYRRFSVPAWLLVGGYVVWNIYSWWQAGGNSNINFIVHISGALFGYLIALTIFRASKQQYSTATTVRNSRRYLSASVNQ